MRRAWLLLLLAGSAVLAVASLYLPWQEVACRSTSPGQSRLLGPFGCAMEAADAWAGLGPIVVLSAILLVILAGAAFVFPRLGDTVAVGQCALVLTFFAAAVFVQTYTEDNSHARGFSASLSPGPGAYFGLAAAGLVLLAAIVLRRDDIITFYPPVAAWPSLATGAALLVVLLFPWIGLSAGAQRRNHDLISFRFLGVATAGGVVAALALIRFLVLRWRSDRNAWVERVSASMLVLLFVSGAATVDPLYEEGRRVAALVGVALALATFALTIADRPRTRLPDRVGRDAIGAGLAATLLAVSLFLPWQRFCSNDLAATAVSGRCVSENGWQQLEATVALVLSIGLVIAMLGRGAIKHARGELVLAITVLVATSGFQLAESSFYGFGYGAVLGFVATVLLIASALRRPTRRAVDRERAVRVAPATLVAALYVAAVVVPWWDVLPFGVWSLFNLALSRETWSTIAAALIGLRLMGFWSRRLAATTQPADELVILPVVLATLALLDAIHHGIHHLTWNTAVLGGLALALTSFGLVERAGGLRQIELPEILRIDRI